MVAQDNVTGLLQLIIKEKWMIASIDRFWRLGTGTKKSWRCVPGAFIIRDNVYLTRTLFPTMRHAFIEKTASSNRSTECFSNLELECFRIIIPWQSADRCVVSVFNLCISMISARSLETCKKALEECHRSSIDMGRFERRGRMRSNSLRNGSENNISVQQNMSSEI